MPPKRTAMTTTSDAKTCSKCGETKPVAEFPPHRRRCRPCHAAEAKAYRAANLAKERARATAYNAAHQEERRAYFAAYNSTRRGAQQAYDAAYYIAHREGILAKKAAKTMELAANDFLRPKTDAQIWWQETHGEAVYNRAG